MSKDEGYVEPIGEVLVEPIGPGPIGPGPAAAPRGDRIIMHFGGFAINEAWTAGNLIAVSGVCGTTRHPGKWTCRTVLNLGAQFDRAEAILRVKRWLIIGCGCASREEHMAPWRRPRALVRGPTDGDLARARALELFTQDELNSAA